MIFPPVPPFPSFWSSQNAFLFLTAHPWFYPMWTSLGRQYPEDIILRYRGAALHQFALSYGESHGLYHSSTWPGVAARRHWLVAVVTCWQINIVSFPRATSVGYDIVCRGLCPSTIFRPRRPWSGGGRSRQAAAYCISLHPHPLATRPRRAVSISHAAKRQRPACLGIIVPGEHRDAAMLLPSSHSCEVSRSPRIEPLTGSLIQRAPSQSSHPPSHAARRPNSYRTSRARRLQPACCSIYSLATRGQAGANKARSGTAECRE